MFPSLQMIIFCLCVLLAVAKLAPVLWEYWRTYRMTMNIPGPPFIPLFGNLNTMAVSSEDFLDLLMDQLTKFKGTFKFWFFNRCVVFVSNPDDLGVVFTSPHFFKKLIIYKTFRRIIGFNVLSVSETEEYWRHRKVINKSLHLENLQDLVPIFAANAGRMARRLDEMADSGRVFDVLPYIGHCANANFCDTILSVDTTGLEARREQYVSHVSKASQIILYKGLRPWLWVDPLFRLLAPMKQREYQETANLFREYITEVVERKMKQVNDQDFKPAERQRETYLGKVLQMEESASPLNKKELHGLLKGLMWGVSSTTVPVLTFFMAAMSRYTDVQENIHRELDEIFGDDPSRPVGWKDLPQMKYLERVLKEVLRFYPSVSFFGREATADVTLPSGLVIPRGCSVAVCTYYTHRTERCFPDPLRFDPDRHLAENAQGRHPYAYVPFSAGVRTCLGQKYAMVFAKTAAATLLRNFCVLPDPNAPESFHDAKFNVGITLAMSKGNNIRLKRRT